MPKTTAKNDLPGEDSPALWACKYVLAFTEGRREDARRFQEQLKNCGFSIRPIRKGAAS